MFPYKDKTYIMIQIEIEKKKYRRTYIGGSKKKETEIFLKVQGTKNDNSDCDWLEYRRLLQTYLKDVITVLSSWKETFQYESYAMLLIAIFFMKYSTLSYISIGLGVLCQIIYFIIKEKEKRFFKAFDMCQTVLLSEIKRTTGLDLDKI